MDQIATEFPRFRIVQKSDSWFQRVIHVALVAVTLGQMRSYLDGYYTTIGKTLYVTKWWDRCDPDERYITLCHELIHLRQFRRYTPPLMSVLYLLIPLPMGLAFFRAKFEKEAYAETLRATQECYGNAAIRGDSLRERILGQFTSASYGWMWPFRKHMEQWYDSECSKLEAANPEAKEINHGKNVAKSTSKSDSGDEDDESDARCDV